MGTVGETKSIMAGVTQSKIDFSLSLSLKYEKLPNQPVHQHE